MAAVKYVAMITLGVLLLASAASSARVLRQEEVDTAAAPRIIFLDDGTYADKDAQPIILDDAPVDIAALVQGNRRLQTLGLKSRLLGNRLLQYRLGLLDTLFGPRYVLVPFANASARANADGTASAEAEAGFRLERAQPGQLGFGGLGVGGLRGGLLGGGLLGAGGLPANLPSQRASITG